VQLTLSYFADTTDLGVLGIYVTIVTLFAPLFITYVQWQLWKAALDEEEHQKDENLEGPAMVPEVQDLTHPDKFYHRLLVGFSILHPSKIRSLLPSFVFWSKMATICMQGIGLTVAYAWNALFVQLLKDNGFTSFNRFGLFLYSLGVTLVAASCVTIAMTSDWMKEIEISKEEDKVELPFESGRGIHW